MNSTITIHGKPVRIRISLAAAEALKRSTTPLIAEMRLFFSCMARKEVRFLNGDDESDNVAAAHGLAVRFRPVVARACTVGENAGRQLVDTPAQNPAAFVPRWLHIDYLSGEWRGEFGYR